VQRYGGTLDKFTGDGIMAIFGAPVALEDHAFRACVAALMIQEEAAKLAVDLHDVDLQLRVGLNSGQVVAGEIGSGPLAYTAIGEQVGMAQRMESVAPPGKVMLSESTARLVQDAAALGESELVHIKGAAEPVRARLLLATSGERRRFERHESTTLRGRTWEMNTIAGILDEAADGFGCVVSVVGSPGIGKSRIIRESAALAVSRGVEVFTTFCESHTSDIPFHAVAGLLRAGFGVTDFDGEAARARVHVQIPGADPEDLLLLDDLLGIANPDVALPEIEADARRRRLTALVNAQTLSRQNPAVFVIEDVHWIDDVSESMLADFLAVIPQTRSTVLLTYRPEYRGALARVPESHAIALRPLNGAHASALLGELLGTQSSLEELAERIAERSAGNPFFAEEIIRDLAERGVLDGSRGSYLLRGDVAEVSVPATLQAAIASRIDRLAPEAKQTLSAAAVIGSRFSPDLLRSLGIDPAFDDLIEAELIDQVQFTPSQEYAFRHPLIRTVAYEAQLRVERAKLHRRLAGAIEARDPASLDDNAALIAEHMAAAGDLHQAYSWQMRAGTWLTNRDIAAARTSWQRARQVADQLPLDDPNREAMRIQSRMMLCTSAYRGGGTVDDTGFDELRELCAKANDQRSLAIGMAGLPVTLMLLNQHREASMLATEQVRLLDSIGDPTLTVGLLHAAMTAKLHAGEVAEALALEDRVIDLADGDVTQGELLIGSPLAQATMLRGLTRCCMGDHAWREDIELAVDMAGATAPWTQVVVLAYPYVVHIPTGALIADDTAVRLTSEALRIAEQSGDEFTLSMARGAVASVLLRRNDSDRAAACNLLEASRESGLGNGNRFGVMIADTELASERARTGDLTGAIEMSRALVEEVFQSGEMISRVAVVTLLVESLLQRSTAADVREAQDVIERLAAVPIEPDFVMFELPALRMRALLARAHGDEVAYRDFRDRYRAMATSLDFEGHIALAQAMT
jgi:adenylate cyclase